MSPPLAKPKAAIYTALMVTLELRQTVLQLPAEDRQELAEVLWDSLDSEAATLPSWQRQILQTRLAVLEANPEAGSSWEEVEARIWPEGK
ncbi:MAG TPA: addiction module protein [Thermoanaerobaculia bacterium]|jgi:putative addiction module component (TIGR02574 family)|nr:addiction module protein [Thermoanaerobaculia bacterium]